MKSLSLDNLYQKKITIRFDLLVDLLKVFDLLGWVGLDGGGTRGPVDGADLAVLRDELVPLNKTECLVHRAADRGVVEAQMLDDSVRVDDVRRTQGVAGLQVESTILRRDVAINVSDEGDVQRTTKATFLAAGVDPGKMREHGVDGDTNDLSTNGAELVGVVAELEDLSGADEGPVQRIEEEDDVLSGVILQAHFLNFAIDDSGSSESRGRLANLNSRQRHGAAHSEDNTTEEEEARRGPSA